MSDSGRSRTVWASAALGLAGSLLVAYAAPQALGDSTVGWWYEPGTPVGRGVSVALVYVGMAALGAAWLSLGRQLPEPRRLLYLGAAWMLPLALAPPLFSRDVYSYLAQGTILHLGHNPYRDTPSALAQLGQVHVLAAVSPFWRHTTAPYGPLFLELISAIVGVTGSDLIAGVLLTRLLEMVGIVLLAICLPRLVRALGTDARRGLWLGLLSPLVGLELVAAVHNDLLMIGLLAAGVTLALGGRPLSGIAVCALAATIKVPALVGAGFIVVAWARAEPSRSAQLRFLLVGGAIAVAVLVAVTVASGLGVSWISTSLFSTPARVRLAITPATAVGRTLASLLGDVGIATSARGLEAALGVVAFAITAGAGLAALYRVRIANLVALLGVLLLVAAAGGPAAWPWYFTWGLVLLAACRAAQRSTALAAALALSVFLVKPNGILALPLDAAPAVVVVYALIGGAAWYGWRRGGSDRGASDRAPGGLVAPGARPGSLVSESAPSALTGT